MIQILPRVNRLGLYGGATEYFAVNSGLGDTSGSATYGIDSAKHPVSVAGTFRHLVIGSNVPHPDVTVTLLVNGVATALAATLASSDALATDGGQEVLVAAGDDVCYRIAGTVQAFPGLDHHSTCLEFEGAACSYGIAPYPGAAVAAGTTLAGGAFGNGEFAGVSAGGISNSFSICAVAGTITRLDVIRYAAAPGGGSWVARLRKNGTAQDGTGGTPNTACTLADGGATKAVATFTLAVAVQDRIDIALTRLGTDAPFALAQVGCSLAFAPTTPDAFMLCGGSNDAIRSDGPDWKWTRTQQLVTTEAQGQAPVGVRGVSARGLYVQRRVGAPGPGSGTVYMLRASGTDTPLSLTIQDLATTGLVTSPGVDLAPGTAVTIQATPVNAPGNNGFHWGLALAPLPAPPPSTHLGIRRLRRAPHLSAEQVTQFFARFQLDLEAGVGNAADPGADPQVFLRWSDDGGHTWRGPLAVSAGTVGAFRRRAIWRRLGRSRDRVFEVSMRDPVKWALLAASLDAAKGTS